MGMGEQARLRCTGVSAKEEVNCGSLAYDPLLEIFSQSYHLH